MLQAPWAGTLLGWQGRMCLCWFLSISVCSRGWGGAGSPMPRVGRAPAPQGSPMGTNPCSGAEPLPSYPAHPQGLPFGAQSEE